MRRQEDYEPNFIAWIREWWLAIVSGLLALLVLTFAGQIWEWNSDEDLQVCEYPWGQARFVNQAGLYLQWFGKVTTYPRNVDLHFDAEVDPKNPSTIRVTFSDAGNGFTSHALKVTLPVEEAKFFAMHRNFAETGVKGIQHAIEQHLATALKNTGPMMTASEFQMQSQNLFYQTVRAQLEEALFEFETVEQTVRRAPPSSKEAKQLHQFSGAEEDKVLTTRIKNDPKTSKPIPIAESPLKEYGFKIVQYSQTETTFDEDTKAQIDARRNAYQLAEQAKASVTKANQETTQTVEAGKANVAKVEAEMRKELRQKVIQAEQDVGVAQEKQKQEVNMAQQTLVTAEQARLEAQQNLQNSTIELAKAEAMAMKTLAEAMAKKAGLEQGGALAPVVQLRAEQSAARRTAIAEGAAKIPAPKQIIFVPTKGGTSSDPLFQMWMMRQAGMTGTSTSSPVRQDKSTH